MMFVDIHTHNICKEKDVVSILHRDANEFHCHCGMDLQHTFYSLGLHPWKIKEYSWSKDIDFIEKNSIFNNVKAIGECGLDKLCDIPMQLQEKVFIAQILISEKLCKPLIIHCVKAFDEIIAIKKDFCPRQAWIIHGFRGKLQQAEQLIKHGFFLSFGTKFNENSLLATPLERLFLETDDVENGNIKEHYKNIAETVDVSVDELVLQIDRNLKLSGILF